MFWQYLLLPMLAPLLNTLYYLQFEVSPLLFDYINWLVVWHSWQQFFWSILHIQMVYLAPLCASCNYIWPCRCEINCCSFAFDYLWFLSWFGFSHHSMQGFAYSCMHFEVHLPNLTHLTKPTSNENNEINFL